MTPQRGRAGMPLRNPGDWFIRAANADADVVTRANERGLYIGLGMAVLAVGSLGALTVTTALSTSLGVGPVKMLPIGVFWGLVLFLFDRGIILGAPNYGDLDNPEGTKKPSNSRAPYLGRIALSLFIGMVIADFACMALFRADIEATMTTNNLKKYDVAVQDQTNALNKSIEESNTALAAQEDAHRKLEESYKAAQAEADCEVSGKCGTNSQGRGPTWRTKQDRADALKKQLNESAAQLEQARTANADQRRKTEDERNQLDGQDSNPKDLLNATGFLNRHEAMFEFVTKNKGALLIYLMVTLTLIGIDMLPLIGKIVSTGSLYERQRRAHAHDVLRRLKRDREIDDKLDEETVEQEAKIRGMQRDGVVESARVKRELDLEREKLAAERERIRLNDDHEYEVKRQEFEKRARLRDLDQRFNPRPTEARRAEAASPNGHRPPPTRPTGSNRRPRTPTLTMPLDEPDGTDNGQPPPDAVGPNGRYRPVRLLDQQGAQATTWLGVDAETGQQVVIKFITLHDNKRFLRFLRPRPRLQGPAGGPEFPYIGEIVDHGFDRDVYYQVSPYYAGGSLGALLKSEGGRVVEVEYMLTMLEDIIRGLASAPDWFHGDIKPDNIVGDGEHLRVIDWGVSKLRSRLTAGATTMPPGTLLYSSPEQLDAVILREQILGSRSEPRLALMDLYSVGCVAFQIATGRPAYARERAAKEGELKWHHRQLPAPRIDEYIPGCPAALADLVAAWVSLKPEQRLRTHTQDVPTTALQELHQLRDSLSGEELRFEVGEDLVVASYTRVPDHGRHRVAEQTPLPRPGESPFGTGYVPHPRPDTPNGSDHPYRRNGSTPDEPSSAMGEERA